MTDWGFLWEADDIKALRVRVRELERRLKVARYVLEDAQRDYDRACVQLDVLLGEWWTK
jgi:hypothetical protein